MNKVIGLGLALLIGAAVGCASTKSAKQAQVCPQCKVVVEHVSKNIWFNPENPWATEEVRRHSCPGCRSALVRLFREGKLKSNCSICAQSEFTCPALHPAARADRAGNQEAEP